MSRAFILLLDSFGLGALPDADKYGYAGANTLGHIAKWAADAGKPMSLPNLEQIGLGAAAHKASGEWPAGFNKRDGFTGAWSVAREKSTGTKKTSPLAMAPPPFIRQRIPASSCSSRQFCRRSC